MRLIFAFILFLLVACAQSEEKLNLTEYRSQTLYCKYLQILEGKDTLIHIIDPGTGVISKKFLLTAKTKYEKENYVTITLPKHDILVLSTPHIGMLKLIDKTSHIRAVANINYVANPELKQRYDDSDLFSGFDPGDLNLEKTVQANIDLILHEGWKMDLPNEDRLTKLNVASIPILDWKEEHALGRAEWILLFGYLTGAPDEAKKQFKIICAEYETFKKIAGSFERKPTVLAGNLFNSVWNAPAGQSYVANILKDAGVNYVYSNSEGVGSKQYSMEQIVKDNQETEFWINPGLTSKNEILSVNPKAIHLAPFKKDRIFCYSNEMSNYWENSSAQPQKILSDFIHIFHGDSTEWDNLNFYKRLK